MKCTKKIRLGLCDSVIGYIKENKNKAGDILVCGATFNSKSQFVGLLNVSEDGKYSLNMNIRAKTANYDNLDNLTICVSEYGSSSAELMLTPIPFINREEPIEVDCDLYYEDGGDTFIEIISSKEVIEFIKSQDKLIIDGDSWMSKYVISKNETEQIIAGTRYDICNYTRYSKEGSVMPVYVTDVSVFGKIVKLSVVQHNSKKIFDEYLGDYESASLKLRVADNLIEVEGSGEIKADVLR